MFKLNNKDTIATSLKFVWCLYCQLWLFNTSVSIVFVVYFEKACLIKFLFSFRYSQASAPFCELKNQREFFLFKFSSTKTRTEWKVVITETSERCCQSSCQLLLVLDKFHLYFLEFSCWIWTCSWLEECNWDLRN